MQIFITILFFIILAAYLTLVMMYLAEQIIEEFNNEFENIESGGNSGR